MQLQQLDYVLAVVDHGSFTAAARARGVSQPSLSQGVRALEAELGAELFVRAGRAVRLTAAGEAFTGPARRALRDVATARAAVAEVAGLAAGRLDLVCLPSLAADPVAVLIGRFRRAHPAVSVRLAEPEDPGALGERIRTGSSELGFAELPMGDDLVAIPLEAHDYVAVVPPGAGAEAPDLGPGPDRGPGPGSGFGAGLGSGAGVGSGSGPDRGPGAGPGPAPWPRRPVRAPAGEPLPLRALADEPLITTPPGTSTRRLIDEALAAAGIVPTLAVETDHREAIAPLVVAGAGVALLPRRLAESARALGAVVRDITPPIVRQVGIVHRPGPLSPAARAFLALAAPSADRPGGRPRVRRRRAARAPSP